MLSVCFYFVVSSSSNDRSKQFKDNYNNRKDLQNSLWARTNAMEDDKRRKNDNLQKSDDGSPSLACSTPMAKELDIDDHLSLEADSMIDQCAGLDLEINSKLNCCL